MTPRDWNCYQCGSRFATGLDGELVEYSFTGSPCLGCLELWAILTASARYYRQRPADPDQQPLTLAAIYARLTGGRVVPTVDYAKAAANDQDEE